MATSSQFGLSCALALPLTDSFEIDFRRLVAHARRCLASGCSSVTVFGTTGEGPSISLDEREHILTALSKTEIRMDQVIGGVTASSIGDAVAQARLVMERGCRAALVAPPFYFKGITEEGLYSWFSEFCEKLNDERIEVIITILTFFSMEEERQMEQTRKLLADAFDKDPIKQQYCVFYVDHLLASGRISPEMTVSVLSTVTSNASNDTVRLEALRMLPQLLKQEKYRQELKPLLVRSVTSLIPTVADVEVLRRQLMLDIQTLVQADESYRNALIAELSAMDESWRFIRGSGEGSDQKEIRVGLQIKLALLSLVQDYRRLEEIAAQLIQLAKPSAELSKFVSDELNLLSFSSRRTAVRVVSGSALQALRSGNSLPPALGERDKSAPAVFIVAGDESQRLQADQLAQALKKNGVAVHGVDVASYGKDARLSAPDVPEIRFLKEMNGNPLLSGLAETFKKNTGQEPKLVGISNPAELDPGTYEIWLAKH